MICLVLPCFIFVDTFTQQSTFGGETFPFAFSLIVTRIYSVHVHVNLVCCSIVGNDKISHKSRLAKLFLSNHGTTNFFAFQQLH